MLNVLKRAEADLLVKLLERRGKGDNWKSLNITYEKPYVERLWLSYGKNRIYLHRIYKCKREEALLHPHPWPSAVLLLEGEYEMGIGYGEGVTPPEISTTIIATAGTRYEMTNPNGWHYVRPLSDTTLSLMVTGPPWNRVPVVTAPKQDPLTPFAREALFSVFEGIFLHKTFQILKEGWEKERSE